MTEVRTRGRKSLSGGGDSPQLRVRVSQSTLEDLSAQARSGTVSETVRRTLDLAARERSARPEERVQVGLHRRVIPKLISDPDGTRALARRNLAKMRQRRNSPIALGWIDEWCELIDGPLPALLQTMLAFDERSIDLRQMGPFAGALSDSERLEAILTGRALAAA